VVQEDGEGEEVEVRFFFILREMRLWWST